MNRIRFLLAALCIPAVVCFGQNARAEQPGGACVACHGFLGGELARPVTEWESSIHRQNGITCDLCHGGNSAVDVANIAHLSGPEFAEKQSQAMSESHGFIGRPSGKAMFDMCAKCHDGSVARYAGSIMGKAYLDGTGGPSCVTCHGAHDNVIPEVPKVCTACHKDTTGFSSIDPMNVTAATVNELSRIRIKIVGEKRRGVRPALAPAFPEELDSYQVGLLAFGAVAVIFLFGCLVYVFLEKEK